MKLTVDDRFDPPHATEFYSDVTTGTCSSCAHSIPCCVVANKGMVQLMVKRVTRQNGYSSKFPLEPSNIPLAWVR